MDMTSYWSSINPLPATGQYLLPQMHIIIIGKLLTFLLSKTGDSIFHDIVPAILFFKLVEGVRVVS